MKPGFNILTWVRFIDSLMWRSKSSCYWTRDIGDPTIWCAEYHAEISMAVPVSLPVFHRDCPTRDVIFLFFSSLQLVMEISITTALRYLLGTIWKHWNTCTKNVQRYTSQGWRVWGRDKPMKAIQQTRNAVCILCITKCPFIHSWGVDLENSSWLIGGVRTWDKSHNIEFQVRL